MAWLGVALAGGRRRLGVVFALSLTALSLPLVMLAMQQGRLPLPYWSFGFALQDITAIEIGLLGQKLADVRNLKPMTSPFLQLR